MCNLDSQKSLAGTGHFWSRSAVPGDGDDLDDHVVTTVVFIAGDDDGGDDDDGEHEAGDYSSFDHNDYGDVDDPGCVTSWPKGLDYVAGG